MSDNTDQARYTGTPEEVGVDLAADALGPTIQETVNSGAPPEQVVRMIAGMFAGLAGILSENFGHKIAADLLRGTAERIEQAAADGQLGSGNQH